MRYEVVITILDPDYVDQLVVAFARQGYAPYINADDKIVAFTVDESDLNKVTKART